MTSRSDRAAGYCREEARHRGEILLLRVVVVLLSLMSVGLALALGPAGLPLAMLFVWRFVSHTRDLCRAWSAWKTWRRRARAVGEESGHGR